MSNQNGHAPSLAPHASSYKPIHVQAHAHLVCGCEAQLPRSCLAAHTRASPAPSQITPSQMTPSQITPSQITPRHITPSQRTRFEMMPPASFQTSGCQHVSDHVSLIYIKMLYCLSRWLAFHVETHQDHALLEPRALRAAKQSTDPPFPSLHLLCAHGLDLG